MFQILPILPSNQLTFFLLGFRYPDLNPSSFPLAPGQVEKASLFSLLRKLPQPCLTGTTRSVLLFHILSHRPSCRCSSSHLTVTQPSGWAMWLALAMRMRQKRQSTSYDPRPPGKHGQKSGLPHAGLALPVTNEDTRARHFTSWVSISSSMK